jgi:hypothetical protein
VSACGGMMLTFGQMMLRASTQMMLCPADTNEKILKAELSGFFVFRVRKGCQARNFAFGENSLACRW